jgi:hypothetical protein
MERRQGLVRKDVPWMKMVIQLRHCEEEERH